MKKEVVMLVILFLANSVFACVDLVDGGVYYNDTDVCNKVYFLENGLKIHGDNILFDCNTAVIRGNFFENSGIMVVNSENVTIKDCNVLMFNIGINIQNSKGTFLDKNHLIKNHYGTKIFNSEDSFIYSADVSLKSPVKLAAGSGNFIKYFNKRIKNELCLGNECNTPLYFSEERKMLDFSPTRVFWTIPFFLDNS